MDLKRLSVIPVFLMMNGVPGFSQESYRDTILISLRQADSIFVSQNLALLAERSNVEASKALIIQARLFKNLNFSVNQNVINTEYTTNGGRKWFDFTDKGETNVQLQKLFLVAGKRNKQIEMAQSGALREEQTYFDLVRTLKYSVHSQFYNINYLLKILKVYDKEISSLGSLAAIFETEVGKGNISNKEFLRIKATLFSLENEKLGYVTQIIAAQTEFNTLMHTGNLFYKPKAFNSDLELKSPESFKLQELIDTAYNYRYDLKIAQTDLNISNINLTYQKAIAYPDLTISGGWDRNGSFVHNYNYVGLQVDLPFFDRNQGNIKFARFNIETSKYKLQSAEEQVKADVINAYSAAIETNRLYLRFDSSFLGDLEVMNAEMLKNFEKRNISLIEFLDYYDAFKTNSIQLNSLMYNRINAFENINFCVGRDIMTN